MIHVIAIITAQPGMRSEIIARVRNNQPQVLAEEGCIEYRPLTDAPNASGFGPDTLVIVEKWQDQRCLQQHAAAPHMKNYADSVSAFILQRDIRIMQDI